MATNASKTHNIKTRQQLIETERNTRKLAQQKRNERKDAFLSAQKQLIKTTEYIEELDQLSHRLTENIENTYHLLNNATINKITHHFSADINEFNIKRDENNNNDNNDNRDYIDNTGYNIDPLIQSFDDINSGYNAFYNESYLMNNIDVPFLSTFQDIPLFLDKIQSCLYSSCIYIKTTKRNDDDNKYDMDDMDDMDDMNDNKKSISVDEYCSYLNAREILIEKLLHFMLIYPKTKRNDKKPSKFDKNRNNKNKKEEIIRGYYEEILPFCLYSLIIIQYQSSIFVEMEDDENLYKKFQDFIFKTKQEIQKNIIKSLQFVNDKPSLLISCLNKYINLLNSKNNHYQIELKWTKMFKKLYEIHNNTKRNNDKIKFIDFISDYSYHSSFYESLQSMSKIVCHSLSDNFKMLFAKLSIRSNSNNINNDDIKDEDKKESLIESPTSTSQSTTTSSFTEIMNSIQQNLSAILTFDHHKKLLKSQLLSTYLDENITPFIQKSTTNTISQFISNLEIHLNETNEAYKNKDKSSSFSLDEEYLEIGICCEKLENYIMNVIDEYCSENQQEKQDNTPISNCLMDMLSSISSLKLRALKFWSSAMSEKLFVDVLSNLENKLSFWNIYESYYTKTIWKSIIINGDDTDNDNDDEIEELTINIPCGPSEYIHDICFQFIQILLMIITQQHVPNSIIGVLENEFRFSTSCELNKIFKQFFNKYSSDDDISESLGLQFYFDVSFARLILTTHSSHKLWKEILMIIKDKYIELVTMEYGSKYLENEILKSVNSCLLMYGVHKNKNNDQNGKILSNTSNIKSGGGGNIFARPINKMTRIALLPVASYQISQSVLNDDENNRTSISSLNKSPMRMGLLNSTLLTQDGNQSLDNTQDKIAQSFNEFTSGAMSHANTLLKNFGSMFQ